MISFKKEVFEIVGESGRFGRVILASGPNDNFTVESRGLGVGGDEDGEPIVESVLVHLHPVTREGIVNGFVSKGCGTGAGKKGTGKKVEFHRAFLRSMEAQLVVRRATWQGVWGGALRGGGG